MAGSGTSGQCGDLFAAKSIMPMLIGAEGEPFDDDAFLYELKIDGERCVAYLDPLEGTELRNKRNTRMLPKVPELAELHRNVARRCILDGELAVISDGKPDFFAMQRRGRLTNPLRIQLAARQRPACFIAFDILYLDGYSVTDLPLLKRKALLQEVVRREDALFAVSPCVERGGAALFEMVKRQSLEGLVAKRRESRYYFGRHTKDWVKMKVMRDEDFVVCGYIRKTSRMASVVLGQYRDGQLVHKGHVSLGIDGEDFHRILQLPDEAAPSVPASTGNEGAIWVAPSLVCTVRYMMKTESGGMRQPVFQGLRPDKEPGECLESGQPGDQDLFLMDAQMPAPDSKKEQME